MTAVLLLGEVPSTGYVGGVAAERVILGPNPPAVPASRFIALAADRLANQRAIIALYPSWHEGAANRFIRLARGVLNTDRIAGLPLDLPPLALSLVADQLTYLAPYVPAGLLASLATRLSDEIIAGAWVRSVAGLAHINTKMADHIRSYLPGAFMVSVAPRPDVHRISGGHPVAPLDHRPQNPIQVLATQVEGDTSWFQQKLLGEVRPSVVKFVNAQPLSAAYWGVKKYVEYVAFSGHPDALSRLVNSTRTRSCAWCGEPISIRTCPFCRATRELLTAQPPTETEYGTLITHPVEPEHAPPAPDHFLTPQPTSPQVAPGDRPAAPASRPASRPDQPRPSAQPGPPPRPPSGGRAAPGRRPEPPSGSQGAQPGDRRVATSADQVGINRANPNTGPAMPPRDESARRPPASTPPVNPRPSAPSPAPPDVSDPRNGVL